MARNGLLASTTSFAHLLGISASKPKTEDDDDKPKMPKDDTDDDKAKGKSKTEGDKPEDKDDDKTKSKAKGGAKTSDDDDDDKPDDQREDETDEEYRERKKREQEEKDDEDDEKDSKRKAARGRERARCAAIFSSKHAAGRADLAAHYAFNTKMTAAEAVASLAVANRGGPAAKPKLGLSERMQDQVNPNLGSGGGTQEMRPHQRLMAAHDLANGKRAT